MRILHTSDWHIGRSFHGHSTLAALAEVLAALAAQVREHAVDVVVVAGDVFDSATPARDCFPLLSTAIGALRDAGAEVIVTSGNHDSAARLGFQSELLRDGIHVVTDPATVGTPVTVTDAVGPVHFYGIPYLEPGMVRSVWPDAELRTHAQTLAHAMGLIERDLAVRGGRSVAIAHCFAAGVAPTPQLERDIQQGGLDVVPLSLFDAVDYTALGHIHGQQTLSERVRYAGAPLHYSFSEQSKKRGSWLIDLDAAGAVSALWLDLPVPRRVVTLRGTLDELLAEPAHAAHVDDWVCAVLTDPTPQIDPMRKLQTRFPWCATIKLDPQGVPEASRVGYAQRVRAATSDTDLIETFLTHVRAGEGADARERDLIDEAVAEARVVELTA
ncbi:exonuclease SbcCD subunit D [Microbacterium sp. CJ88]|uniref:exonuclease SbcCD subunit D n=1 Tax=Microbacterium sp. CJ88 TaxID=3445672 RepID=UPI003F660A8C